MSVANNLPSDLNDKNKHIENGRSHLITKNYNLKFGSEAKTLTKILDEAGAPKEIDFLSLDVEGAELAVLSGINFKRYKFKYMLIECRKINIIKSHLNKHGYKFLDKLSHHDFLFKLNEV